MRYPQFHCMSDSSFNEQMQFLKSQFSSIQSSYLLLIATPDDVQCNQRGPTTFQRERKNFPDVLIEQGISSQEFRRLFRLTPDKYLIFKDLIGMFKKHGVDMRSSHIHVNIILC